MRTLLGSRIQSPCLLGPAICNIDSSSYESFQRRQDFMILIIGTPKKGASNSWNAPYTPYRPHQSRSPLNSRACRCPLKIGCRCAGCGCCCETPGAVGGRINGCFYELGVLSVHVLIIRALLLRSTLGPLIFGNSHIHIYTYVYTGLLQIAYSILQSI